MEEPVDVQIDPARPDLASTRVNPALSVLVALLALAWCAAPVLAYAALIVAAPFFGETPSDSEIATSHLYAGLAIGCGILGPVLGMAIGLGTGRRPIAVSFAVLLTMSLGAVVVAIVLT